RPAAGNPGGEPLARRGGVAPPAHAVVPQYVVVGAEGRGLRAEAPAVGGPRWGRGGAPDAGRLHLVVRGLAGAPVHGERDRRRAALRVAQRLPVRQGRLPREGGARARGGRAK